MIEMIVNGTNKTAHYNLKLSNNFNNFNHSIILRHYDSPSRSLLFWALSIGFNLG